MRGKVCSICGDSVPSCFAEADSHRILRCPVCRRRERPFLRAVARRLKLASKYEGLEVTEAVGQSGEVSTSYSVKDQAESGELSEEQLETLKP